MPKDLYWNCTRDLFATGLESRRLLPGRGGTVASLSGGAGRAPCAPNTGSYGKARGRLPEEMMARLAQGAGQRLSQDAPVSWRGKGRTVKLVDGSTVSMPDPPANQQEYPQHPRQQQGLGFPIARVLGVFCLASGSWVTRAVGRYQGKETGALAL